MTICYRIRWVAGIYQLDYLLSFTAITDAVDPSLGIDLNAIEVTFYAFDLVSTGEFTDGSGNTVIAYTGGTLEVYQDLSQDADWGVFPPNATSPSTFNNGTLLFRGPFNDFTIVLQPSGAGAYEGHLDGVAGLLLSVLCSDCGYTWGGAFTEDTGAQIPDGYDLQLDGSFEVDIPVTTETSNWSQVKSLYR